MVNTPTPPARLCLPAELTIYTVSEARSAWLAWLDADATLAAAVLDAGQDTAVCQVDASACDEIDAAGAQLLLALAHSLARQQRRLQLCAPSTPLRRACADLGLTNLLLDGGVAA